MSKLTSVLKSVFAFSLLGALLGGVAGTFFGRAFLPWYNTPGDGSQALTLYQPKLVLDIVDSLVRYQLLGALAGALGLGTLTLVVRLRSTSKGKPSGELASAESSSTTPR